MGLGLHFLRVLGELLKFSCFETDSNFRDELLKPGICGSVVVRGGCAWMEVLSEGCVLEKTSIESCMVFLLALFVLKIL